MYTPEREINPPPYWEKNTEDDELYIDCEMCLEPFLAENIQSLGNNKCVCPECVELAENK